MYKKILAANWKMNLGLNKSIILASKIAGRIKNDKNREFILFPSCVNILSIKKSIKAKKVLFGAQDCSQFLNGAFTGDVSASMLSEIGCKYIILGHSERRLNYYENASILRKKVLHSINNNLKIIYCVGENLNDYKNKKSKSVIRKQLSNIFNNNFTKINLIIAYEPVWAIGSNKTPAYEEIEIMHYYIKNFMEKTYSIKNIRVLYGGSVNANNSKDIFLLKNVDGGLIGGSSLNASDFIKIYANLN